MVVIAYEIDLAIICQCLEIAVVDPIPAIEDLEHHEFSPPEGELRWTLIHLVAGVAAYLDRL